MEFWTPVDDEAELLTTFSVADITWLDYVSCDGDRGKRRRRRKKGL